MDCSTYYRPRTKMDMLERALQESIQRKEMLKRRQMRISQARQQAAKWVKDAQGNFKDVKGKEVKKLIDDLTEDAEQNLLGQIQELADYHDGGLDDIGAAHIAAANAPDYDKLMKDKELENQKKAKERGRRAMAAERGIVLPKEKVAARPESTRMPRIQRSSAKMVDKKKGSGKSSVHGHIQELADYHDGGLNDFGAAHIAAANAPDYDKLIKEKELENQKKAKEPSRRAMTAERGKVLTKEKVAARPETTRMPRIQRSSAKMADKKKSSVHGHIQELANYHDGGLDSIAAANAPDYDKLMKEKELENQKKAKEPGRRAMTAERGKVLPKEKVAVRPETTRMPRIQRSGAKMVDKKKSSVHGQIQELADYHDGDDGGLDGIAAANAPDYDKVMKEKELENQKKAKERGRRALAAERGIVLPKEKIAARPGSTRMKRIQRSSAKMVDKRKGSGKSSVHGQIQELADYHDGGLDGIAAANAPDYDKVMKEKELENQKKAKEPGRRAMTAERGKVLPKEKVAARPETTRMPRIQRSSAKMADKKKSSVHGHIQELANYHDAGLADIGAERRRLNADGSQEVKPVSNRNRNSKSAENDLKRSSPPLDLSLSKEHDLATDHAGNDSDYDRENDREDTDDEDLHDWKSDQEDTDHGDLHDWKSDQEDTDHEDLHDWKSDQEDTDHEDLHDWKSDQEDTDHEDLHDWKSDQEDTDHEDLHDWKSDQEDTDHEDLHNWKSDQEDTDHEDLHNWKSDQEDTDHEDLHNWKSDQEDTDHGDLQNWKSDHEDTDLVDLHSIAAANAPDYDKLMKKEELENQKKAKEPGRRAMAAERGIVLPKEKVAARPETTRMPRIQRSNAKIVDKKKGSGKSSVHGHIQELANYHDGGLADIGAERRRLNADGSQEAEPVSNRNRNSKSDEYDLKRSSPPLNLSLSKEHDLATDHAGNDSDYDRENDREDTDDEDMHDWKSDHADTDLEDMHDWKSDHEDTDHEDLDDWKSDHEDTDHEDLHDWKSDHEDTDHEDLHDWKSDHEDTDLVDLHTREDDQGDLHDQEHDGDGTDTDLESLHARKSGQENINREELDSMPDSKSKTFSAKRFNVSQNVQPKPEKFVRRGERSNADGSQETKPVSNRNRNSKSDEYDLKRSSPPLNLSLSKEHDLATDHAVNDSDYDRENDREDTDDEDMHDWKSDHADTDLEDMHDWKSDHEDTDHEDLDDWKSDHEDIDLVDLHSIAAAKAPDYDKLMKEKELENQKKAKEPGRRAMAAERGKVVPKEKVAVRPETTRMPRIQRSGAKMVDKKKSSVHGQIQELADYHDGGLDSTAAANAPDYDKLMKEKELENQKKAKEPGRRAMTAERGKVLPKEKVAARPETTRMPRIQRSSAKMADKKKSSVHGHIQELANYHDAGLADIGAERLRLNADGSQEVKPVSNRNRNSKSAENDLKRSSAPLDLSLSKEHDLATDHAGNDSDYDRENDREDTDYEDMHDRKSDKEDTNHEDLQDGKSDHEDTDLVDLHTREDDQEDLHDQEHDVQPIMTSDRQPLISLTTPKSKEEIRNFMGRLLGMSSESRAALKTPSSSSSSSDQEKIKRIPENTSAPARTEPSSEYTDNSDQEVTPTSYATSRDRTARKLRAVAESSDESTAKTETGQSGPSTGISNGGTEQTTSGSGSTQVIIHVSKHPSMKSTSGGRVPFPETVVVAHSLSATLSAVEQRQRDFIDQTEALEPSANVSGESGSSSPNHSRGSQLSTPDPTSAGASNQSKGARGGKAVQPYKKKSKSSRKK